MVQEHLQQAIFLGDQTGADRSALASADVFFNPSLTEAFGNVTLEAMACGLPSLPPKTNGFNEPGPVRDHWNAGRWN